MSLRNKLLPYLRTLGFWGFMFFLVKGLAWLAIPWLMAKGVF
jgi:hypothetical protein